MTIRRAIIITAGTLLFKINFEIGGEKTFNKNGSRGINALIIFYQISPLFITKSILIKC